MSDIRLKCPSCATALKLPEQRAGQALKCPRCGKPFRVPAAAGAVAAKAPAAPPKPAPAPKTSEPWEELHDEAPASRPASRKRRPAKGQAKSGGRLVLILALVGGGVLLLGGGAVALIASGVFRSKPPAEQAANKAAPTSPQANPAPAPKPATPRELLLGSWQGQEKDAGNLEFRPDGSLTLTMQGGAAMKGTYNFIEPQTIQVQLEFGGQMVSQKLRIQVDKDSLTTTDEMNKAEHFRRGTAVAAAPQPKAPDAGPKPQPAPAGGGVTFTDPQKVFEVKFPRPPERKTQEGFVYYEVKSPAAAFNVNYSDIADDNYKLVAATTPPDKVQEKVLEDYGPVALGNGTPMKRSFRLAGKYPAIDVVAGDGVMMDDGSPARVWGRYVLVRRRLFTIDVWMTKAKADEKAAQAFLDSFRILDESPIPQPPRP